MSRNLGDTSCRICNDEVKLEGQPHAITKAECGPFNYEGMIVDNARCRNCDAKYLAWVDVSACGNGMNSGHWKRRPNDDRPFVDLSFRASFNDEPAAEDLPTPECLQRIHEGECIARAREIETRIDQLKAEAISMYDLAATGESHWESYRR